MILVLYKETVRRPETWVAKIWWEQEGLDMEGGRAAASGDEGAEEAEG